jgi:hypothetical protein
MATASSKMIKNVILRNTLLTDNKLSTLIDGFNFIRNLKKLHIERNTFGVESAKKMVGILDEKNLV